MKLTFYNVETETIKELCDISHLYALSSNSFLIVFKNGSCCIFRDSLITFKEV